MYVPPLISKPCVSCAKRWADRKQVQLGAETICGGCLAKLSPGKVAAVHAGDVSVLVCPDCADHCRTCRPVDARLQWGDEIRTGAWFRARAKAGPQTPAPDLAERECEGCIERFVPAREGQKFHSKACADRDRYLRAPRHETGVRV